MKYRPLIAFGIVLVVSCTSAPSTTVSQTQPTAIVSPTSNHVPSNTPSLLPTFTLTPAATKTKTPTSTPAPTATPDLPVAPTGFEWKFVPESSLAFLMPEGWHFKAEKHETTYAYFATKENIDEVGQFSTGMTINVVNDKSIDAVEYAKGIIENLAKSATTKKIIGQWEYEQDPVVSYQLHIEAEYPNIKSDDPNHKKTLYYTTIAHRDTNTLYIVMFESPIKLWDVEWETGAKMIQLALLGN